MRQEVSMHARGVAIAVICAVTLVAGVATAQAFKLVGTKAGNLLVGSKGPDRLVGKGGGDLIKGRGGNDRLSGGKARDLLNGGPGADRLIAGPGNDGIKAADGRRDRLIDGGRGTNVCVVDIPADLPVVRNCATLRIPSTSGGGGGGGGGEGGGPTDPKMLQVTSAQGLTCVPILGCLFTITGSGTDALVGTVTAGGAISLLAGTATNGVVTGTWVATGTYNCAPGATGWLVVTMGTKSTPQIPVQC
jgi:RTX calcium-binding nonapeptide repeat (4 copies)